MRIWERNGGGEERLYRSTEEIAADVRAARAEMERINERVNVRAVLLDLLSVRGEDAEGLAREIRLAVEENRAGVAALRELEERLAMLTEELSETERMLAAYAVGT